MKLTRILNAIRNASFEYILQQFDVFRMCNCIKSYKEKSLLVMVYYVCCFQNFGETFVLLSETLEELMAVTYT